VAAAPVSVGTTVTVVYVVEVTLVVVAESGAPRSLFVSIIPLHTLASGIYSQVGSPVTVTMTVVQPQRELELV
jgi:hypothetical protein